MITQDSHTFQGMRRDNPPIKQDSRFLWEAHNIRLTNVNGDNTLLDLTNERGPKDTKIQLLGSYVGHCSLNDYLVVFTVNKDNGTNYIYRIANNEDSFICDKLYEGLKAGLKYNSLIQTIGIYESNYVQKVYWISNNSSPKTLNIVKDKLEGIKISSIKNYDSFYHDFDFVPELELKEDIIITRGNGEGTFSPGTIQYAFSYFNKYGQESNIFYVTELLYISYNDRGGNPEESISNNFRINIENVDHNFDYLRVYSIHRTSIDAIPEVKIVTDIPIPGKGWSSINFTDTGKEGSSLDPTKLLYIGGEDIIASAITVKDNTLFLGNITINRPMIPSDLKESLKNYIEENKEKDENNRLIKVIPRTIKSDAVSSFYPYGNQLQYSNPSTFKVGDTYRLGIQCQYKNGKWSEPLWIGDYEIPNTVRPHVEENNNIVVPEVTINLEQDIVTQLTNLGYKKVRALMVPPTIQDRTIIAQGIVCPTVYSVKDRINNSPFVQSSWFFRPMMVDNNIDNTTNIDKGSVIAYRPFSPLLGNGDRGAEIQDMVVRDFSNANNAAKTKQNIPNTFFIDQSILTFHSPDIEFNDSIKIALDDNNYDLHLVGVVPFKNVAGDISIQTSSAPPSPNDTGFYHRTISSEDYSNRGLIAGLFYKSHVIDDDNNATKYQASKYDNADYEYNWLVYPWNRSGSLNNDIVRPEDKGTRTSNLKRKIISNIRVSEDNDWFDTPWSASKKAGITRISIFDSNEVTLNKLDIPNNSNINTINYYGNVDSLITTDTKYDLYLIGNSGVNNLDSITKVTDFFTHYPLKTIPSAVKEGYIPDDIGNGNSALQQSKEPVRMKYKSSPHAVFAFNNLYDSSTVVLPKLNINGSIINESVVNEAELFWVPTMEKDTLPSGIVFDTANISNVISRNGNSLDIELDCIQYLESNYKRVVGGNYSNADKLALMTSSLYPNNNNYADLYISLFSADASEAGGTYHWSKYNMTIYRGSDYYKHTDSNNVTTYWKKIKVGDKYCLKRLILNTSTKVNQDIITYNGKHQNALLYLAELRRASSPINRFGGNSEEALRNNSWIPAGTSVELSSSIAIPFMYGDTYYQRYDCLKTYAFTNEDENSVVDIASFMCETRVNIDGRYDKNRGQTNNLNMSSLNFNLYNEVYSQKDNFFNYRVLGDDYYKNIQYPVQVAWSTEKSNLEDVDSWTNITLSSVLQLDGTLGKITSLNVFNDSLLAFQEGALNVILFNSRVQIQASDGVPIEIANSSKVEGFRTISNSIGCLWPCEIAVSPIGVYFIDDSTKSLYLYNGQLTNVSDSLGAKWWLFKHLDGKCWSIPNKTGIKLNYDILNQDLHLCLGSDDDLNNSLCYSEKLKQFTSLMSYSHSIFDDIKGNSISLYCSDNTTLWENFKGEFNNFYGNVKLPSFTYISNDNPSYNKIFDTIEYRADIYDKDGNLLHDKSFDWIRATNEYQDSGVKSLSQARRTINNVSLRKKFRVWRGQIPRQGRERIRNLWTAISLGFTESTNNNFHLILHDISTKYTI